MWRGGWNGAIEAARAGGCVGVRGMERGDRGEVNGCEREEARRAMVRDGEEWDDAWNGVRRGWGVQGSEERG